MYQHNLLFLNSCIKNVCQVVKIARAVEECEAWRPSPPSRTATRPSRLTILRSFLLSWKSFCTLICLCLYCLFTPIKCEAWWPSPRTCNSRHKTPHPGILCVCIFFLNFYLPLSFRSDQMWSMVTFSSRTLTWPTQDPFPQICGTQQPLLTGC